MKNRARKTHVISGIFSIFILTAAVAGCGGGSSPVGAPLQDVYRASDKRTTTGGGGSTTPATVNISALIDQLQAIYDAVDALDGSNFVSGQAGKDTLLTLVSDSIAKLQQPNPNISALTNFINNNIITLIDGCGGSVSGAPDGNDVINNCAAQATIYQLTVAASTSTTCGGVSSVTIATSAASPIAIYSADVVSFTATGFYSESTCGSIDVTSDAVWSSSIPSAADFTGAAGELTGISTGDVFVSATVFGVSASNQIAVSVKTCDEVIFADAGLESAVRANAAFTGQPSGRICADQTAGIKLLSLDGKLSSANLSGIEKLTALRTLYLQRNNLSDISPLASLPELRKVILNYNSVTDLSPLGDSYWLINLSAIGNGITDISPLAGISNLITVNLSDNQISDVSALGNHSRILSLIIENNNISDISALSGLARVEELRIDGNSVSDISALAGKSTLKIFTASNNSIADIGTVSGWSALNVLAISKNGVTSLAPVSGLTSITNLIAEDNLISDLSPLSGLTALESVVLNGNRVVDVSPLQNVTGVSYVGLHGNLVEDASPLALNAGIGAGDQIVLSSNPLSADSIGVHIPAIVARGAAVSY